MKYTRHNKYNVLYKINKIRIIQLWNIITSFIANNYQNKTKCS